MQNQNGDSSYSFRRDKIMLRTILSSLPSFMAIHLMNTEISPQVNMIRPFYRSLLFYFAMLGFVFIAWAWRDSGTHGSILVKKGRWGYFSCKQEHGGVEFSNDIIRVLHIKSFYVNRAKNYLDPCSQTGGFVFPEAIIPIEDGMGGKGIRFSYWLILLVYTIVWSAILFAWQSYRSKIFKRNQIADLDC